MCTNDVKRTYYKAEQEKKTIYHNLFPLWDK